LEGYASKKGSPAQRQLKLIDLAKCLAAMLGILLAGQPLSGTNKRADSGLHAHLRDHFDFAGPYPHCALGTDVAPLTVAQQQCVLSYDPRVLRHLVGRGPV
jgi:hypothetical protein